MTRVLPYCAFLHRNDVLLPATGVNGGPLHILQEGELQVLWSEVEWPFAPAAVQQNAVEFHHVVTRVFSQTAVAPFRLLSVFDNGQALATLVSERQADFVNDLQRLQNFVQMECVIFSKPSKPDPASGKAYLLGKAELLNSARDYIQSVKNSPGDLIAAIRTRELKSGSRIFVLVERGREKQFRSAVEEMPVPAGMTRRISGPWPAAEFLSESVKMPQQQ